MGYIHINNLYKCQDIMLFREYYALEKVLDKLRAHDLSRAESDAASASTTLPPSFWRWSRTWSGREPARSF